MTILTDRTRPCSKEQAIELWMAFCDTDYSKKEQKGYEPGYSGFVVALQGIELVLFTNGLYELLEYNAPAKDIRRLNTPYGDFTLTEIECQRCRDAWQAKPKSIPYYTFEQALEMAKTSKQK